MTPLIETFRYGFLGEGSFSWAVVWLFSRVTLVFLLFGIIIFNKVEKDFVDTV